MDDRDHVTLDSTFDPNPDVRVSQTTDGAVLLDAATGTCWELNTIGAAIWRTVAAGGPLRVAMDELTAKYSVERSVLESDILKLLSELTRNGLLAVRS